MAATVPAAMTVPAGTGPGFGDAMGFCDFPETTPNARLRSEIKALQSTVARLQAALSVREKEIGKLRAELAGINKGERQ
jgi:hypothetical protein